MKGTLVWVSVLLALWTVKMPAAAAKTESVRPVLRQEQKNQGEKAVFSVMGMSFIVAGSAAALIAAWERR